MKYISEIYFIKPFVDQEMWTNFINKISKFNGYFRKFEIVIKLELNQIRYYIKTNKQLPPTINNLDEFLFKECEKEIFVSSWAFPYIGKQTNIVEMTDHFSDSLKYITVKVLPFSDGKFITKTHLYFQTGNNISARRFLFCNISAFLSVDFQNNKRFFYKKPPKYLNIQKTLHLFKSDSNNTYLEVDTFPYFQGKYYLNPSNYNFAKHSMVIGSSGTGKSKLISLLIDNISNTSKGNYKIVVIDPHASLEKDIGGIEGADVIDFKALDGSIDLFANSSDDVVATTELLLSLFKTLIADQYNSKLERVLRHSIHTLLVKKNFTFVNLRKLILDLEYRNSLIKEIESLLPDSVVDFFLADFNDLKTKSYSEAISPIISFIDEMQLLPVFNQSGDLKTIEKTVTDNFLTIFSLDRTKLGDKITKTIAGLILQQMLSVVQTKLFDEQIILIIDEVSVVENPIIGRLLSEARKYGLSIILAQQYFNQISEELKDAIFANVVNYYTFRVSRADALVLADNLSMDIPIENTTEAKVKVLTGLNDRECIVRVNSSGVVLPAFKAKTVNFKPKPYVRKEQKQETKESNGSPIFTSNFRINEDIDLSEILAETKVKKRGE